MTYAAISHQSHRLGDDILSFLILGHAAYALGRAPASHHLQKNELIIRATL